MIKRLLEKWFRLEPEFCQGCETLKAQIDAERENNSRLVQALIEATRPPQPIIQQIAEVEPKELKPRHVPWRTRQAMLEQEDRQRANLQRQFEQQRTTAELEREVGIDATRPTEEAKSESVQTAS